MTNEDVRHVRRLKSFHFATLPHDDCPAAIKVRVVGGGGLEFVARIKLEQCDIVNRYFIATLLAAV